jgi:adenine phosphoribosyltransferase
MDLRSLIRSVPDFPKPGIMFRDVTPLLHHPPAFKAAIEGLAAGFADHPIDCVVGIESRGFMFGSPLAYYWQASFVPARKPGKLPPPVLSQSYRLEYGTDRLEMREQFLTPGSRVLIVDDLIATGGTAAAAAELVKQAGGELCGFAFVIELSFLQGRQWLPAGVPVHSLISYENEL